MELRGLKEARSNGSLASYLDTFVKDNMKKFEFSDVDYFVRQEIVSITEEAYSQEKWDQSLAGPLISTLKTLARDAKSVDVIFTSENVKKYVTAWAKLPSDSKHPVQTKEQLAAVACLVNAVYNSAEMRKGFGKESHEALKDQLKGLAGQTTFSPEENQLYNLLLRILFVVTALQENLRSYWRSDAYFNVLGSVLEQSMALEMIGSSQDLRNRASEVLKTVYNLYCKEKPDAERAASILKLVRKMLFSSFLDDPECCQNSVNLIFALPTVPSVICPKVQPGQKCLATFEDRDMSIMKILLEKLEKRIDGKEDGWMAMVTVFVTALFHYCQECPQARRYVRLIVLPPLKDVDVERQPDEGDSLRNKLIRIMHSVGNDGMISQLMFVLCKKSVPRLIKYTGFGHSAGHLANAGLLGEVNAPKSDDNSEDSETEEYAKVEDQVNPVTGCLRPLNLPNPFEGMSEEQKMFEAEKLMTNLNEMLESGLIKPATIGEDGQTRPFKHILEMTKNVPERKEEDSDSD